MKCENVEQSLSAYIERSLPQEEMVQVAEHLQECSRCLELMEEIRSILVTCRAFPSYEVDSSLVDRILLRTSGKTRSLTLRERFRAYFLRPVLTPRFAAGAGLVLLFLVLLVDLIGPRMGVVAASLSPRELFRQMDRGVQRIYSEGQKLYLTKNEWQEQFTFYKNNMFKKLGFMIEQLDAPVEGNKKSNEPEPPKQAPGQKSSVLLNPA